MRGSLMRMWTKEQHIAMLAQSQDNTVVAKAYTDSLTSRPKVTRQNVEYWRNIFQVNEGNMAAADRAIKQTRKLRKPELDDDLGVTLPDFTKIYHSILVIPDQHAPYHHPDTIDFLAEVAHAFSPDMVVNLGDEVDHHALSFHDSDPNLDSAGTELEKAKPFIHALNTLFPSMLVCSSNHGSLAFRKAKAHGIPVQYLKSYREVLFPTRRANRWSWAYEWRVKTKLGDVVFKHQSANPASEAAHLRANLVVGHNHGRFDIDYKDNGQDLYYGMTVGCLIDRNALAFAYGKHTPNKPVIGCAVIIEGRPVLIPMVLNNEGRWIGSL